MVSSSFLPVSPEAGQPSAPNLLVGATSPLWAVFGGAALAGATWWWWSSRWREAVNLEALIATPPEPAWPAAAQAPSPAVSEAPEDAAQALATEVPPVVEPLVEAAVAVPAALAGASAAALEAAAELPPAVVDPALAAEVLDVKAAEAIADDLTALVGVGPKLAASLAELGVTRFSQIAAWGVDELSEFDRRLNLKGRAEREAWVAQAKRLAERP